MADANQAPRSSAREKYLTTQLAGVEMKLNLALLQVEVYRHMADQRSWPNPIEEVIKMAALLDSELQSIYDVVRDRANLLDLAYQATLKIATETLLRDLRRRAHHCQP